MNMKKLILAALSAMMLLTAAGCTVSGHNLEPAVPSPSDAPDNTLGITLTAENVTPTGLTLVCTQSGGEVTGELMSGSYYSLELYTARGWEPAKYAKGINPEEVAWTAESWVINMGGEVRWETNWEWLYGKLPAGWYRVGKEILDWRAPGDFDRHMTYAVFEVKQP